MTLRVRREVTETATADTLEEVRAWQERRVKDLAGQGVGYLDSTPPFGVAEVNHHDWTPDMGYTEAFLEGRYATHYEAEVTWEEHSE